MTKIDERNKAIKCKEKNGTTTKTHRENIFLEIDFEIEYNFKCIDSCCQNAVHNYGISFTDSCIRCDQMFCENFKCFS